MITNFIKIFILVFITIIGTGFSIAQVNDSKGVVDTSQYYVLLKNDGKEVLLDLRKEFDGRVTFMFILSGSVGEFDFFSVSTDKEFDLLLEKNYTGEIFINESIFYINGITVSKKLFDEIISSNIEGIKLFCISNVKESMGKTSYNYELINIKVLSNSLTSWLERRAN